MKIIGALECFDVVADATDVEATCAAAAFIVIGIAAADDGDVFDVA